MNSSCQQKCTCICEKEFGSELRRFCFFCRVRHRTPGDPLLCHASASGSLGISLVGGNASGNGTHTRLATSPTASGVQFRHNCVRVLNHGKDRFLLHSWKRRHDARDDAMRNGSHLRKWMAIQAISIVSFSDRCSKK